jgi:pimeloyl-ACP methyl ester carboxylesterase
MGMIVLLVSVSIVVGFLLFMGPGTARPFIDESGAPLVGSISEKIWLTIGGVEQGMFIKGTNADAPVLLYLHGGMPDHFLTGHYPTGLDEEFIVVWWEQRGSGLSYSDAIPAESVDIEQLVSDALELTNYLRKRFDQEKIYLMGHSGGTFLGIHAAARAPDLYHAYLGVAQMSKQLESERLAYDYMLARFKDEGNTRMVCRLEEAPVGATSGKLDHAGIVWGQRAAFVI